MGDVDDTGTKSLWQFGLVVAGVVLLSALLIHILSTAEADVTSKASALISEYNVPLDVRQCVEDYEGYVCQADAEINIPDNNTGIEFVATAQVLLTMDDNALHIIKVTPSFEVGHLLKYKIPANVRDALSKITLIPSDNMYCLKATDKELKCYIPTNMAPLGNATLYYAPLFEITLDNNTVKRVIVYV